VRHGVGAEQLAELRRQVLGLTRGGRDREDRRLLRERVRHEGSQRLGCLEIQGVEARGAIGQDRGERGLAVDEGRQSGQGHAGLFLVDSIYRLNALWV
jgi:hypothetical protein